MPKFKGPNTQAMLAAGATGAQAELRAREKGVEQEERSAARVQQGFTQAGQMLQREGERQDELAFRKEKLAKEMELGERRAGLTERGQDIQAAKAGLMEAPGAPSPGVTADSQPQEPPPGPTVQEQKGLEMDRQGRFISTPEAQEAKKAARGVARSKAATALMNAQTASTNAQTAFQKSKNAGKIEGQKAAYGAMVKGLETTQGFYEKVVSGEVEPQSILINYKSNPAAKLALEGGDPDEMSAVAARLVKAQRDYQALSMMQATGELPPYWGDPTSPTVKKYNSMAPLVAASLDKAGAMFAGEEGSALAEATGDEMKQLRRAWMGFTSDEDKQRFIRRTTARVMVESEEIQRARGTEIQSSGLQQRIQEQDQTIQGLQQELAAMRAEPGRQYAPEQGAEPGQGVEVPRTGVEGERDQRYPQRVPRGQPTPVSVTKVPRPAGPALPGQPELPR